MIISYPRILLQLTPHNRALPVVQKQAKNTTFVMTFLCTLYERRESFGIPSTEVLSVYKELMKATLPHLTLRKPAEAAQVAYTPYDRYGRPNPRPAKPASQSAPIDGTIIARILGQCLSEGYMGTANYLTKKMSSEAGQISPKDFTDTIISFLKATLNILRQHRPADLTVFEEMYQKCLDNYIRRYVEQEPVQINWSRRAVSCPCHDCYNLNQFLRSPVDQVGRFPVGKQRRHHLHCELDLYTDCTHMTERRGNPQTLVVTKTGKTYQQNLRSWQKRVEEAEIILRDLDSDFWFVGLLGEKYPEIMNLRAVRVMTATPQAQHGSARRTLHPIDSAAAGARTNSTGALPMNPPQIVGRKRKAVVIDLTEEGNDD